MSKCESEGSLKSNFSKIKKIISLFMTKYYN